MGMPRVLIPREKAQELPVVKGATLEQIFNERCRENGSTWEEFTLYNFGTSETRGINRALTELVGCAEIDENNAAKSKLDPALAPANSTFKLRLPEAWQAQEVPLHREHVVRIKKRLAPPGVSITALDRWFLPKTETCRIGYALDGSPERADKASVAVYASRYCSATLEDDWGISYPDKADLASEELWSKMLDGQAKPQSAAYSIDDWKGESTAIRGVLKKRHDTRYVNVACSPYTVVIRFYKHEDDKAARIELEPFWPQFEQDGKAAVSSLEIRWSIHGTLRTFEHGQLLITDKDGQVVLREALDQSGIATKSFTWNDGRNVLIKEKMPYRAQLQVHTGETEDNGVALAAMHTEVRLWVHPKTGEPKTVAQSLAFEVSPFVHAGDSPPKGSNRWYGLRLAELGYHPGPVDGDVNSSDFKLALKEFQRSYPKKAKLNNEYVRLEITGAPNADTEAMLERDPLVKSRPLFGQIKSNVTYEPEDLDLSSVPARLQDEAHAQGLILWADDQHYYTHGPIPANCDPNLGLGDYRGDMELAGDGKVDKDQDAICRPWIPLAIRPRLLSRNDELSRETMPDWNEAMAACVGPLRVDWTFSEAVEDLKLIDTMMTQTQITAPTHSTKVRTSTFIKKTLEKNAFMDNGKTYSNCPKKYGGLRPDAQGALGGYYKELFGLGAKSLAPWKASDDTNTTSVCCAMHDDLGQAPEKLAAERRGAAGVYFHPSHIAGDGYRVHAAVSFAAMPGKGNHPNRAVLAARYPQAPAATTCKLRIWRRTTLRGHVRWTGEVHDWTETAQEMLLHYRACHVHMSHTGGVAKEWTTDELIDLQSSLYADTITQAFAQAPYNRQDHLAPKAGYVWPWTDRKHLGIHEIPDDSIRSPAEFKDKFLENVLIGKWRSVRDAVLTRIVDKVEKTSARYRGHTLVSFSSTPTYYMQAYYCSGPQKHRNLLIETRNTGDSAIGDDCHVTACTGKLQAGYSNKYSCPTCNTEVGPLKEPVAHSHPTCEALCSGTKRPNPAWNYICDACGATDALGNNCGPGYACGVPCGGNAPPALNQISSAKIIQRMARDGLPLPANGAALGAAFVFPGKNPLNWAHELGHHRHFEHAASAPGAKPKQHDSRDNPNHSALHGATADEKRWDRCCIMSYSEKGFFCGKCVLKNRGWKVENLDMPAEKVNGL